MIKPLILTLSLALGQSFQAQERQEVRPDVGYVPTPTSVVEAMLELAEPGEGELIYDLGCGDGRIVITAARRYGTRGVGIDIDPDLIARCRSNAEDAEVADLVRFEIANLFETDFHEADVVSLYLLTWMNIKLRPRLLEQLHPGARIVSHRFGMDEWPHDRMRTVTHEGDRHSVMLWIVPANITGTWTIDAPGIASDAELRFEQLFQHARGNLRVKGRDRPLLNLSLRGADVAFEFAPEPGEGAENWAFSGRAHGHTLQGELSRTDGSGTRTCKAWRNPATMRSIEPRHGGRSGGPLTFKKR